MKTRTEGHRRRVIIYCRISDDREGERSGVDRQEKECRRRAEKHGWDIVAVLTDNDLGAYSGKRRPEYERMLDLLRAGEADAVLALAPTRIYRRIKDAFEFFDLIVDRDIKVETIKQGRYDLSTADGRRDARRAAIDAQYEAELIGERVRDAKAETLAEGGYRGGPRPFGYAADGVTPRSLLCPDCGSADGFSVDRECEACGADAITAKGSEAWYIEQAATEVVAGSSLRSICRDWAAQGVRTVPRRYRQEDGTRGEAESREWKPEELRKMLLRPRNAGLVEHRGKEAGRAAWPAILKESTWRAVCSILEDPSRRTSPTNERRWLGSGLYRCGAEGCEETVRCSTSGTGSGHVHLPAYRCRTGRHITRAAVTLDDYIQDVVVARLSRPDAVDLLEHPGDIVDVAEADRQLLAARASLKAAAALLGAGEMDADGYRVATAAAREREKKAKDLLALAARTNPLVGLVGAEDVPGAWERLGLSRRRAVIDCLMEVRIRPARRGRLPHGQRLDIESVDIQWRKPGGQS